MKKYIVFIVLLLLCLLCLTTCTKDERQMLVQTGAVTNILTTSAYVSGDILDLGEGVSQHGHCWSTSPNTSTDDTKTTLGIPPGTGGFTSELAGLLPGTTYFVKAYCSKGGTTVYGSEINFTTASADLPQLTTAEVTGITKTAAVSGGNITSQGGTPVTAKGVCWSTATEPTTGGDKTSNGTGTGGFTSNISGLSSGTTYFVRAYATNAGGTEYGNELSFTTDSDTPVPPTVHTSGVTSVTTNSASCGGEVTDEGSESVTAKGVCWSIDPNPTTSNNTTNDGSGPGSFTSSITGLDPGTSYYVRAYATSSAGTSYGNESDFATEAVLAELVTLDINTITSTSAKSGGNITSDGGADITARGVCWSISTGPTLDDSQTNDGLGTGTFISDITGLTGNTTYFVRAYATNSVGTKYGNELSFKTSNIVPSVTTSAITSVTSNSAICGGNISDDGGSAVTARGVCWSTNPSPDIADDKTNDGSGTGSFNSSLTSLSAGTAYYVRAYATNGAGTAYGEEETFTTDCVAPTATTGSATGITTGSASLNGTVNASGFSTVVTFEYGTTTGYGNTVTANQSPVSGSALTNVGAAISSLSPNTTYHFRVKAENCGGTVYGSDQTFITPCVKPTATTSSASNIAFSTAVLNGIVNANSFSTEIIFEYGLTTAYGSTKIAAQSPLSGSLNTSVSCNISSLVPNTTYHFRVKAENCGGVVYGLDQTFTTDCRMASASIAGAALITDVSTSLTGYVSPYNSSTVVTFEYGTTLSYGSSVTASNSPYNGTSSSYVTAQVSGLVRSTTYHYRMKAVNCGGTSYSADGTFTTTFCPPSLTVTHTAGNVAPVDRSTTYYVEETNLTGSYKCWITKNLGAYSTASSATDSREDRAGWYWQFNKKQGYKHDGSTRTPATSWISSINEASDWTSTNDPCRILLGTGWHIPTMAEWEVALANGGWDNVQDAYSSVLRLHAAGILSPADGSLLDRGGGGYYQTSTNWYDTNTRPLIISSGSAYIGNTSKSSGTTLRCIKD